ncbi:MAG TPA: AraC family transcriptional regulator [Gammaproteobacteria bacterium]|nr:AraC family transcriptional regulator [Gammaproteobacteria bacterium]
MLNFNEPSYQGHVNHEGAYMTYVPGTTLRDWVQCFWQLNVPAGLYSYRSIPDNSVDCIFNLSHPPEAFVIAPFVSPNIFELTGPVSYWGIRFRVLGHRRLMKAPVGEWSTDSDINAAALLPAEVLHNLSTLCSQPLSFEVRCRRLEAALSRYVREPDIDVRLLRYLHYCQKTCASNVDLSDRQCAEFGLSSRQLRRLTQLHLGVSPRAFVRVMRFQYMIHAMHQQSTRTQWANFYYDQPHLCREFKALAGVTPSTLMNSSVLYNTEPA